MKHLQNMFLHTQKRIFERYGILISYSDWLDMGRDAKYDTPNKVGAALGGKWYQRISFQGETFYAVCSALGVHTILSKKQVKSDLKINKLI